MGHLTSCPSPMVPARSRLPRLGGYGWRGQAHAASQPPWPSRHSAHCCGVTSPLAPPSNACGRSAPYGLRLACVLDSGRGVACQTVYTAEPPKIAR